MSRLAQSGSEEGSLAAEALQRLLNGEQPPGIRLLANGNNTVFVLDAIPDIVFKAHTSTEEHGEPVPGDHAEHCNRLLEERWQNISACREFVRNRPHLIVPDAIKLECHVTVRGRQETRFLVACQRYEVKSSGTAIESDYTCWCKNEPEKFERTVREFIGFVADTAYNDVCFRNNPVIAIDGEPYIVLLDLEYCAVPTIDRSRYTFRRVAGGLWAGDHDARGLCRHLTPEMAERVLDLVPVEHQEGWRNAIAQRRKELRKREGAEEWFAQKAISSSNRRLLPESAAQLDGLTENQRQQARQFIRLANNQIVRTNSRKPLWAQRQLYLKRNDPDFPYDTMKPIIKALKQADYIFGTLPQEELRNEIFDAPKRRYRVVV